MLLAQPVHHLGAKTQENIAFAILTRARLEEASGPRRGFGRTVAAQLLLDLSGCHGSRALFVADCRVMRVENIPTSRRADPS